MASEEIMRISFGPQHPMSGQIRVLIGTDGEKVYSLAPDLGFTHRGIEKILEKRTFLQGVIPVERLSMVDGSNFILAYVRAVEEIMGIEIPERAKYIRTILCEISRINSHLYAFGLASEACGGYPAVFLWTTGDRELLLDLCEILTGARWSKSFIVPGGVRGDIPQGFKEKCLKTLDFLERRLETYREAWLENEVFKNRTVGVGVLSSEKAITLGATGPNLRASGVRLDVRKDEPYAAYDKVDFNIAVASEGDSYARLLVRYMEMKESIRIIRQAIKTIPEGPIRLRVPTRAPPGEAVSRVETARGEVIVHMITDGSQTPYRVKLITPSFRNLFVFSKMPEISDVKVADVPVLLYSFDPWYLDADR